MTKKTVQQDDQDPEAEMKEWPKIPEGQKCCWFSPERVYCGQRATMVLQIGRFDFTFLCKAHYDYLRQGGIVGPS